MKKVLFIAPVLLSLTGFSQNILMTNLGNQSMPQVQTVQVFASNMMLNANNTNKPARANANPQVQIQRASTSNANENARRQSRRISNIYNPVQTNSIIQNNSTDEIQQVLSNVSDNNVGNAFGNESLIEQIASANIPAIQMGTGSLNLNIDMPTIKLPSMKFASRKTSSSSSKHKAFSLRKKMAKLDRKMSRFSLKKKMRIKVDNCFKF